ncbi:MAG: PIN domain-containing protein [Campylobacterales bacterium]|nr:PIN domain-containing protein [Campylobacterales bacterium]
MKNIALIDSGVLVALFDKDDKYYQESLKFIQRYNGELVTTWSVITEVTHLLGFNLKIQLAFLRWVERGAVQIYTIEHNELHEMISMIERYTNVPMDLADASLMFVAQKWKINQIISIDSDFDIYRTITNKYLQNLFRT